METGETHQETLKREIFEELGCRIEVGDFITVTVHDYPDITVVLHSYFARIVEGEPEPKEHASIVWMPMDTLYALDWAPADEPTVDILIDQTIE